MFVWTMNDRGDAEFCYWKDTPVGCDARCPESVIVSSPASLIRTIVAVIVVFSITVGCRSAQGAPAVVEPFFSGVNHFDVAFSLVQDGPIDDLLIVYSNASRRFTEMSRLDRAEAVLRAADEHILARDTEPTLQAKVERVRAWHALAGADDRYVPVAREVTSDTIDQAAGNGGDGSGDIVSSLRGILDAQLENPNLEEDSVRHTLDEMYLIDDDTARVDTLVYAAESIARMNDNRTLNPVVQQSIAVLPIIEPSLTAASLGIRLAVLSDQLGRPGDVAYLVGQAMERAESGLIVEPSDFHRITAIIDGILHLEARETADLPDDAGAVLETIVANVSPLSMRVRATGAIALVTGSNTLGDVYGRMLALTDDSARTTVSAEFIRKRSRLHPEWNPGEAVSRLLGSASLSGMEPTVRVQVLADLGASYYFSERFDEFSRLRGLIGSIDEYNRVLLSVAEYMEEAERPEDARTALSAMSDIPEAGFMDDVSPRYRTATIYRRLGDFDRAVATVDGLNAMETARVLVSLPADFLPNPASNAVLARIAGG